jgi:hypothetical protein
LTQVIQIVDVDEFDVTPVLNSIPGSAFAQESAAYGTQVGIVATAMDADATTNGITYTLDDNAGGRFSIDSASGVVTVSGQLDRETGSTHSIVIRATSSDMSSSTLSISIAVLDVDEFDVGPIVNSQGGNPSVSENAVAGTTVGLTANAVDSDATTNTIVYTLDSDANGSFGIDSATGQVRTLKSLNHELTSSLSIVVRATSADGSFSLMSQSIDVLDVAEVPVGQHDTYSTSYIDDVVVSGRGVLLNDMDPDGDAMSAIMVSGPSQGTLLFSSDGSFRYTPVPGFLGTVAFAYRVTDGSLLSDPITVTIQVTIPTTLPSTGGLGAGSSGSSTGSTSSSSSNSNNNNSGNSTSVVTAIAVASAVSTTTETTSARAEESAPAVQAVATVEVAAAPVVGGGGTSEGDEESGVQAIELREMREVAFGGRDSSSSSGRRLVGRMDGSGFGLEELDRHRVEDANRMFHFDLGDRRHDETVNRSKEAIETVMINTAVGTGLVLWVVQGAQIAATLISVAPAWVQLDPLAMISQDKSGKGKNQAMLAGEKLFER